MKIGCLKFNFIATKYYKNLYGKAEKTIYKRIAKRKWNKIIQDNESVQNQTHTKW